jgi:hypothetical protein
MVTYDVLWHGFKTIGSTQPNGYSYLHDYTGF